MIRNDNKGENIMNELNCKNCETPTACEEGVVNVTCGYCCATVGCTEEN